VFAVIVIFVIKFLIKVNISATPLQLLEEKTTEEIENTTKAILPIFYSSVELESLPGNYEITQENLIFTIRVMFWWKSEKFFTNFN
jgi:hypothetical protein